MKINPIINSYNNNTIVSFKANKNISKQNDQTLFEVASGLTIIGFLLSHDFIDYIKEGKSTFNKITRTTLTIGIIGMGLKFIKDSIDCVFKTSKSN